MPAIEVLRPGIHTTVQDQMGRRGWLAEGFFPAGAMDPLALSAANLLAGNPPAAAGLEVILGRLSLRFETAATIAVCGPETGFTVAGVAAPLWTTLRVGAGEVVELPPAGPPGFRLYVAVHGGLDVPLVLGSRSTFEIGSLGGHHGRALRRSDRLTIGEATGDPPLRRVRPSARPRYARTWSIEVVPGPQGAPEYVTEAGLRRLLDREWAVSHHSNRVGIRLERTAVEWARASGGIAGAHPSNILDQPYPVGAVNVNGDTPVILGPDGPTAGGFVVIATVPHGALWKLGQVRPGSDRIVLRPVADDEALALAHRAEACFTTDALEPVDRRPR